MPLRSLTPLLCFVGAYWLSSAGDVNKDDDWSLSLSTVFSLSFFSLFFSLFFMLFVIFFTGPLAVSDELASFLSVRQATVMTAVKPVCLTFSSYLIGKIMLCCVQLTSFRACEINSLNKQIVPSMVDTICVSLGDLKIAFRECNPGPFCQSRDFGIEFA